MVVLLVAAVGGGVFWKMRGEKAAKDQAPAYVEIQPTRGSISSTIITTGSVQPRNRLEVRPPMAGRLEELTVKEGDRVRKGQVIGWMSSNERAALLDAASARNEQEVAYWKDVYKPTPVIAPIEGDVIVRSVEPGQTVGPDSRVIVLSDSLIVKAQVDETDIGKVKVGQRANVTLDAYPDVRATGQVEHISYESRVVNNVTIYDIEVVPETIPAVFRSGMSAAVMIVHQNRDHALLVPAKAVDRDEAGKASVKIADISNKAGIPREITVGISDDANTEVTDGLQETDKLVIREEDYVPPSTNVLKNPFLPTMRPGGGRPHR
jgi:macrolide-specific efflux system membrane fusion protein